MNRCDACGVAFEDRPETCPHCGGFRTIIPTEDLEVADTEPAPAAAVLATELEDAPEKAVPTGWAPWDKALGGGLVPGSSVLLYGDAGGRKTTWAGALATRHAKRRRGHALFLCAEMPGKMVRDAVNRLTSPDRLYIVGLDRDGTSLAVGVAEIGRIRPKAVVYDSIQTFEVAGGLPRSEYAIATVIRTARAAAAAHAHVAILISQVNSQGKPAGPHASVHSCDVIVRVTPGAICVQKNRFVPAIDVVLED